MQSRSLCLLLLELVLQHPLLLAGIGSCSLSRLCRLLSLLCLLPGGHQRGGIPCALAAAGSGIQLLLQVGSFLPGSLKLLPRLRLLLLRSRQLLLQVGGLLRRCLGLLLPFLALPLHCCKLRSGVCKHGRCSGGSSLLLALSVPQLHRQAVGRRQALSRKAAWRQ